MCRITAIKGPFSQNPALIDYISQLQQYGGTLATEIYQDNDVAIILDRFDITSSSLESGYFPLQNEDYVLAFNGEIYSYQNNLFKDSYFPTDAHFAMNYINRDGHQKFFSDCDYEGTFIVYQKKDKNLFVYTDQLNSKGCFYSKSLDNFIVTQEISILENILQFCSVPSDVAIETAERSCVLKIDEKLLIKKSHINPDTIAIWQGTESAEINPADINILYQAVKKSIECRIPKAGKFGALCSGGVDSSIIVRIIVDHLIVNEGSAERLCVFTMGKEPGQIVNEDSDLEHARMLIDDVNKIHDTNIVLEQLYPDQSWIEYLINNAVLCDNSQLITPNPVQTQVRHTVMMSVVLAEVVIKHPDIKVVLTGDFADEIFGGYNSMHDGTLDVLRKNIQSKMDDLNLNDASRVTLASLKGCKFLLESIANNKIGPNTQNILPHPVEIRTPYLSKNIMQVIADMPDTALVGKYTNKVHSKFILRLLAKSIGIADNIAFRKKIPFNEGGTGSKNSVRNELEEKLAEKYFNGNGPAISSSDQSHMNMIGTKVYDSHGDQQFFELALYFCAVKTGFARFLHSGIFDRKMPDSNYSTETNFEKLYAGKNLTEFVK